MTVSVIAGSEAVARSESDEANSETASLTLAAGSAISVFGIASDKTLAMTGGTEEIGWALHTKKTKHSPPLMEGAGEGDRTWICSFPSPPPYLPHQWGGIQQNGNWQAVPALRASFEN
ncbi:MAG: hypothetical protein ACUBOA_04470 [Candidatus Loosdrechtia sp.]|uniref:hypothetical protein n=1 Tax=Candidatus Loosdrechtia sp. TaxID=3101272 RepID=UPI003A654C74|nr:MAG: hypothetical protein QY305_12695 [Candidatus Jettenia sp. AMX2]